MHINKLGLTLVEILVVILIFFIVTIVSVVEFSKFLAGSRTQEISEQIVSTLRTARDKTLARENGTVYGVHFESDKYVLFADKNYVAGTASNVVYHIPSDYSLSTISLTGGGPNVIFEIITGSTSESGSIVVEKNEGSFRPTSTIHIYANGIAEIE